MFIKYKYSFDIHKYNVFCASYLQSLGRLFNNFRKYKFLDEENIFCSTEW